MIKINLLSPADKMSVKWKRIDNLIKANSLTVIVVLFTFIIFLGISFQYLNVENSNAKNQIESIEKEEKTLEIKKMENNIRKYESQLKFISQVSENHIYWTKLLSNFNETVPEGVKIKSLEAKDYIPETEEKDGKNPKLAEETSDKFVIDIIGNAKTRDDLLKFEDNLKNSNIFTNLTTKGFYNYEKKVDISFSYIFYIKKKDLTKGE